MYRYTLIGNKAEDITSRLLKIKTLKSIRLERKWSIAEQWLGL